MGRKTFCDFFARFSPFVTTTLGHTGAEDYAQSGKYERFIYFFVVNVQCYRKLESFCGAFLFARQCVSISMFSLPLPPL
jgi:hypothetical protein